MLIRPLKEIVCFILFFKTVPVSFNITEDPTIPHPLYVMRT